MMLDPGDYESEAVELLNSPVGIQKAIVLAILAVASALEDIAVQMQREDQ